ncbi:MAG TPA: hypothetical protein VD948_01270 [Rhodothermales bacterium]|nr:hypothetical protein [Rhodothermales bacterium]
MVALTIIAQWLHVFGGIVWFGGYVLVAAVVWPMLFSRPAAEARQLFGVAAPRISRTMAVAGQLVLWFGLLRGTWLGPIKSFDALTSTPYGHTFALAILLTIGLIVHGATSGPRLAARVWNGDDFQPDARRYVNRSNALSLGLLGLILVCMVLMRFGW